MQDKEYVFIDTHQGIDKYFEKIAEKYPERVAVREKNNIFTYRMLNQKANQLANHLLDLGIKELDCVGVYFEPSIELIISILAILKISGICVPIDPEYNAEKVKYIIENTNMVNVICNNEFINYYSNVSATIPFEWQYAFPKGYQKNNLNMLRNVNDLAFIFYTSGTTGEQKGVLIPHGAVLNDTLPQLALPPLTKNDVFLLTAPVCTTRIIGEIFYPILAAAQLFILDYSYVKNASAIIETIIKEEVSVLFVVPTMLRELMKSGKIKYCKSLKYIQSMGEKLSENILQGFFSQSNACLVNIYGQTEAGNCSMAFYTKENSKKEVNLGKSVNNRKIWIVDEEFREVDRGKAGRIAITGPYLSAGYLNDENLTKKHFKKWKSEKYDCFISGDLGRINARNELEYLGRYDDIIKLGGKRISLTEIENVLLKHNNIENAVVFIQENNREEKYVMAAVQCLGDADISYDLLIKYLQIYLPEYAIPRRIVSLKEFPLTTSGKIDKKRVMQLCNQSSTDNVFEFTENEERLAKFWAEILEMDYKLIDPNKTFVELGASSLAVAICSAEIEEKIGNKNFLMQDIMTHSLKKLAEKLYK